MLFSQQERCGVGSEGALLTGAVAAYAAGAAKAATGVTVSVMTPATLTDEEIDTEFLATATAAHDDDGDTGGADDDGDAGGGDDDGGADA